MPAIHLAKLKDQCAQLAALYEQPVRFVRQMHKLLNFYSNRTHRAGQSGAPPPLTPAYNVPRPVMRQIIVELSPLAAGSSQHGLEMCDTLWVEDYYEFRYLAAYLLGQIAPDPAGEVLNRIIQWSNPPPEVRLLSVLMEHGMQRLRVESPESVIEQIETWLSEPAVSTQRTGLNALIPFIESGDYENLPVFFKLLSPLIRKIPEALRDEAREALQALARRSPIETAQYLRQYLEATHSPDTAWLARQCLPLLPQDSQTSLRAALRQLPARVDNPSG